MKRFCCFLLCLCLGVGLLSGCGTNKDPGATVAMGRYLETELGLIPGVDTIRGTHLSADGDVVAYGIGQEAGPVVRITIPATGSAPETEPVAWVNELLGETGNVVSLAEDEGGSLWLLYSDELSQYHLVHSKDGASVEELVIPDWKADAEEEAQSETDGGGIVQKSGSVSVSAGGSGVFVSGNGASGGQTKIPSGLFLIPGGDVLVLYSQQGASRYSSTDGRLLREYLGVAYRATTNVGQGKLLMASPEDGELVLYNLEQDGDPDRVHFDTLSYRAFLGLDVDGVYLADSTGIYRQAEGGSIWEKLVDGDLTSLSMPNLSIQGCVSDGQGGFYALLSGENDVGAYHYTYSADTPTIPDTELSISALQDNATVRLAIGEFQRRNPNVRVNFQVLMGYDAAATVEDVIRALNTEILGGNGPDLLVLDGLPAESYMEKGVLADLTDLLGGLKDADLMENLLGAYQRDGGLYALPSRFAFPVMMGRSGDVDAVGSLADLAAAVQARQGEVPSFLNPPAGLWAEDAPGAWAELYYKAYANQIVGPDGQVDEVALADFFQKAADMDETMKQYQPQSSGYVSTAIVVSFNGSAMEAMDMGPSEIAHGNAQFSVQELGGYMSLRSIVDYLAPMGTQKLDTLFGAKQFYPKGNVGILNATEHRTLAEDFIRLLLSQTVQGENLGDGFSVSRSALQKRVEKTLSEIYVEGDMGFLDLCLGLTTPVLPDQTIEDAVLEQLAPLMTGQVSAQQAAQNVVEKTRLYLAE